MFVTPEYVFKDVTHITPEWLAAKGIRALVDGISEVSCDTADRFDLLRHVDGCRIAQSRGHIAGEAESGADPPADGVDGVKDFVDQVIV